jgi:predicted enzyme related to lactoylglutathione lyase
MADQTNAVNWFEIPVDDLERAKKFYESVLGVELAVNQMGPLQMGWFPSHEGAPGATGSLVKGEGYTPSHAGSIVYLHVDDVETALGKVNATGGKTLVLKTGIGEYGFIGHFEDSEGNRVALHSNR